MRATVATRSRLALSLTAAAGTGRALALALAVGVAAQATSPARAASAAPPPEIRERVTPAGRYFTDAAGLTLYVPTTGSGSAAAGCEPGCGPDWLPVRARAASARRGEWAAIARADGTSQWTWRGRPLYRFARDDHAGATLGEGPDGAWRPAFDPVALPAGVTLSQTLAGRVLADARGLTLYWRKERTGKREPAPAGRGEFTPFAAPALAVARPPWTIVTQADGTPQWAYDGRPLYASSRDHRPGDIEGHRAGEGWQAAALEPPPDAPAWVTVQVIDTGPALADARGLTLYAARSMEQIAREKTCLADCMRTYWRPVLARPGETPVGNWSIRADATGRRQWHFRGSPVFTHTRDRRPGDSTGAGFGVGQGIGGGWRPIMQAALLPPT